MVVRVYERGKKMIGKLNKKQLSVIAVLVVAVVLVVSLPQLFQKDTKANTSAVNAVANGLEENVQDGVILHAFNWSYDTIKENLPDIAAAGYSAVQTSPVQQPKDYDVTYTKVEEQWWKLYQPLGFSIATNSWLGSSAELKLLCNEADKYGIKIIVDIVANHLANDDTNSGLCKDVADYEKSIYEDYKTYFHEYIAFNENTVQGVVQGNVGKPDLNTSNAFVQSRVIALLKKCIDCGVDGFRFDCAKNIETENDGYYASDFWGNVIGTATSYAKSSKKIDLYCYGEILDTPGQDREYSDYVKYMSVTDNVTSDKVTAYIADGKALEAAETGYNCGLEGKKIVLWAESYSTYMGESGAGGYVNTSEISVTNINKAWALNASRKDATAVYFARPSSAKMGELSTSNWSDAAVVAINKFHNAYVGSEENISATDNFVINERYTSEGAKNSGAVIINTTGKATEVTNVKVYKLVDGEYSDYITGAVFTVKDGVISGHMGDTGIAVLYGNVEKQEVTTVVETTTRMPMETTEAQAGMLDLYFDASNCSWFTDNNASPVLKVDEKDFVKMEEYDNPSTGKKIYYSKITPDTKKITIARLIPDGKISNAYTFDYMAGYDLYISKGDWTEGGVWSVYAGLTTGIETVVEHNSQIEDTTVNHIDNQHSAGDESGISGETIVPSGGNEQGQNDSGSQQKSQPADEDNEEEETKTTAPTKSQPDDKKEENPTPPKEEETKEPSSGMIKIYFTNNRYWDDVYCYYWGGSQANKEVEWPGTKMSFVKNNEYGQSVYCMEMPADVTGIVFNNGKTGSAKIQTNDICHGITNGVGFYITTNSTGNQDVASYVYK